MKDRYLFRGKRLDNSEWITGCYIFGRIAQEGDYSAYFVDEETIGQCTGLEDKNGNLIFEGDQYRDEFGNLKTIHCIHDFCCFEDAENCEIIGNIHEAKK